MVGSSLPQRCTSDALYRHRPGAGSRLGGGDPLQLATVRSVTTRCDRDTALALPIHPFALDRLLRGSGGHFATQPGVQGTRRSPGKESGG
jgi:hypothetical protein